MALAGVQGRAGCRRPGWHRPVPPSCPAAACDATAPAGGWLTAGVCAQATGDVLEVAIGTGHNLPYYPDGTRLPGIDFSPQMLQLARRRADRLGRPVDLRLGGAQALELPDACFDTVVCTLALCAIPDQRRAIAEMRRVLRPGGRLLLLDHVAAAPRGRPCRPVAAGTHHHPAGR